MAWAASRTKDTYLRKKYEQLVSRKGKKKALIAIGHKILCAAYHILKNHEPYKELGYHYLENLSQEKKSNQINSYLSKLKTLGVEVEIKN